MLETQRVDLVLLDNYLPDGTGLSLMESAELAASGANVMVVTAESSSAAVHHALARGAVNYLIKPFESRQLVERLTTYGRYRALFGDRRFDQSAVDRAMRSRVEGNNQVAAKGQSPMTVGLILGALAGAPGPVSAVEVASEVGMGRATAARYLSQLVSDGRALVALRYGSTGRPEHEYSVSSLGGPSSR